MNETIRLQLSAFVDGELPDNEAELLLRRMSQDGQLRQQVAEYLAIGRAMRGEVQVAGIATLRDRIAAELGEAPVHEVATDATASDRRYLRPLAGFAVAATVAVVAIFGLGRLVGVNGLDDDASRTADSGVFPTQPDVDDLVEQLRQVHDATADSPQFEALLTGVEITEEHVEIDGVDGDPEAADEADDEGQDEAPAE